MEPVKFCGVPAFLVGYGSLNAHHTMKSKMCSTGIQQVLCNI